MCYFLDTSEERKCSVMAKKSLYEILRILHVSEHADHGNLENDTLPKCMLECASI